MNNAEQWISVTLATFAVYRLSRMVTRESGAFNALFRFREWVFRKVGNNWINEGVNCPYCVSFWFALIAAILLIVQLHYDWLALGWLWFGLAGMVAFLFGIAND